MQCTDLRLEKWEGGSWVACMGCGLHPKGREMHLQVSPLWPPLWLVGWEMRTGGDQRDGGWRPCRESVGPRGMPPGESASWEGCLPPCGSVDWPMAPSEGGGGGLLSLGEAWHLLPLHPWERSNSTFLHPRPILFLYILINFLFLITF